MDGRLTVNDPFDVSDVDLVIAGGGLAGATLALALNKALPDLKVMVVESYPLKAGAPDSDYQPSYDARSTALSFGSSLIFQQLGLWNELARHAAPIRHIHVSDRGHFGATRLHASEYQQDALGYVADNRWMGQCLMAALAEAPTRWCAPASVVGIERRSAGVTVKIEQDGQSGSVQTQALIVADGGRSSLRETLGFHVSEQHYGQNALIANVTTAEPHNDTAFERFTDAGPMALLPRQPQDGRTGDSSLVWTLDDQQLEELLALAPADRCQELQKRFGWRLGRFLTMGECSHYPLSLKTVAEPVQPGVALIGNAAHTLHPVAGQGFNLTLRGIMTLVDALQWAVLNHKPLGSLEVLGRYRHQHAQDREDTVRFSDSLIQIFGLSIPGSAMARDAGLVGLDLFAPAKRWFARKAMGLGGRRMRISPVASNSSAAQVNK